MKRVLLKRHIHIAWGGGELSGSDSYDLEGLNPKIIYIFFNAEMLISVGKNITENMKGISYI